MSTRSIKLLFCLSCSLLSLSPTLFASTGREIMEEQSRRHTVPSEKAVFTMTLVDAKGRERERTMVLHKSEDQNEPFKSLIQFTEPQDIRGVGLLTWQGGADASDDQWLYLPATRQVKRIAGSNKKSSFMGTDFAYEDLQREDISAYNYTILGEETLEGEATWVIEATPATAQEDRDSGYEKRKIWVRKDNYLTTKVEFYGPGEKLLKTGRYLEPVKVGEEAWRGNRAEMKTHASKTRTILVNTSREINPDIPAVLFTRQGMRRPVYD